MIIQKIKQFLKWLAEAWEDYCKTESDRYNNGYYDRSDRVKMNCCYCKTDWEIKSYGVSYRCIYPEFISKPVIRLTDNKPTFFCGSLEEAEKLKDRIEPFFKTEKPNVDFKKFNEAMVKSMSEMSSLSVEELKKPYSKEYIDHTERLMSNVYGMEIEPKGIDSLFSSKPTISDQMHKQMLGRAIRGVSSVPRNITRDELKREKVIDKIMEDLK